MITACNTVNIVKKNKETGTSQKQSYISASRQFGNLVTLKADKAGETADTHCRREPSAVQQPLAGNLYPDPDLLQCNCNSMEINPLNCVNCVWIASFGFYTSFKWAFSFFPTITTVGLSAINSMERWQVVTATLGFLTFLLCCSWRCWIGDSIIITFVSWLKWKALGIQLSL